MQENICEDMQERIGGAVLSNAVSSNNVQLRDVDTIWPSDVSSKSPAGADHKRVRFCYRSGVFGALLSLFRQQETKVEGGFYNGRRAWFRSPVWFVGRNTGEIGET